MRTAATGRRLEGKVAVVTGAARGMGAAIAKLFAAHGASVELVDVLADEGEAVANEIDTAFPGMARFSVVDIASASEWARLMDRVRKRSGAIDVLVNNAGITQMCPLEEITVEEYERLFGVNELGVFLGMQAVFPFMRAAGGGSIVNTSSGAAIQAPMGMAAYTATKMAVLGLTRAAAGEWGHHRIRVNAILPGAIDTAMMRGPHTSDVDFGAFFASNPIPRPGEVDEIAAAALFLASDESSYVTGVALPVDGGRSAARVVPRQA